MQFVNLEFKIPLLCTLFMSLLLLIYYTKPKIKYKENNFFEIILISTSIFSLANLIALIMCSLNTLDSIITNYYHFLKFLNVIMTSTIFVTALSLLLYNVYISKPKFLNRRNVTLIYFITTPIFIIINILLEVEFTRSYEVTQSTGPLITISYSIIGILLLITFLYSFINKSRLDKRFQTIVYMLIFIIPMLIITYFIPSIMVQDALPIILTYIMYFTIENPDVKMVNQLNLAVDAANKANMAKSDFLSSMSHEIRTPLNAIVGLSEDMISDNLLPNKFKEDATDIVNASNTLLEIVGNIMDISKIESQKMEITNSKYVVKDLIDGIIKINETRIGDKDLNIFVNYAVDLPYELYGDKLHLKQIINNLVSNAIKYTDKGHIKINVKSINKNNTCILIISIEDTGKGIKKEHLKRLYDKFDRLDAEKNSTIEGTGLGLAITKKLVDILNGTINVQSSYGYGSLFIIQIPQTISSLNKDILINDYKIDTVSNSIIENKKILIVDDNNLNIKVAKRIITKLGALSDECYSGKEAIEKIKNNNYDLILMDIMMPEMGGEETLKILKNDVNFNIPVIALTADAVSDAEEKYLSLGFDSYLPKPFSKMQLEKKLNEIFKKSN